MATGLFQTNELTRNLRQAAQGFGREAGNFQAVLRAKTAITPDFSDNAPASGPSRPR
jgi:hypothetical protein